MSVIIQRPLRGSRISSFYPVKSLPLLSSLDSAFQLQEYISLLIRLDVHDVESIVSIPGKSSKGESAEAKEKSEGDATESADEKDGDKERKSDVTVDEACWIYEQLRRLAQDLTHPLITMLQQECTRASCPEMKAGEWLYLCVAHGNDGAMEQCCAIDYILHTLDSATALLNSPRTFPSRLQVPTTSHRHFSSLARRLGRIFAHAYFHHREAFEQAEAESSLYARFLALTSKFELVPAEFLVIPARFDQHDGDGEGDGDDSGRGRGSREAQPPRLLAASVHPQHLQQAPIQANEEATRRSNNTQDREPQVPSNTEPVSGWVEVGPVAPSGNGTGGDSPRKFGRSRTDTMVFSEAANIVEELAKGQENPDEQDSKKDIISAENFSILKRDGPPATISALPSSEQSSATSEPPQLEEKPQPTKSETSSAVPTPGSQETAQATEPVAAAEPVTKPEDETQISKDQIQLPEADVTPSSSTVPETLSQLFPEVIIADFVNHPPSEKPAPAVDAKEEDSVTDVPLDVSGPADSDSEVQVEHPNQEPGVHTSLDSSQVLKAAPTPEASQTEADKLIPSIPQLSKEEVSPDKREEPSTVTAPTNKVEVPPAPPLAEEELLNDGAAVSTQKVVVLPSSAEEVVDAPEPSKSADAALDAANAKKPAEATHTHTDQKAEVPKQDTDKEEKVAASPPS